MELREFLLGLAQIKGKSHREYKQKNFFASAIKGINPDIFILAENRGSDEL
jgi:hypothetical protein